MKGRIVGPGDAYWIDSVGIGPHLWLVLSWPFEHDAGGEGVLLASVTTRRFTRRDDTSCVLDESDHPDLRHESFVRYDDARRMTVAYLDRWATPAEPLRPEVLQRVLRGAAVTERIRLGDHELLVRQGLLPEV